MIARYIDIAEVIDESQTIHVFLRALNRYEIEEINPAVAIFGKPRSPHRRGSALIATK